MWELSYNRFMVVICAGMPRSASTWSFNVCTRLLRAAYPSASIGSGYSDRLLDWLANEHVEHDHFVLKSHVLGEAGLSLLRLGAARAVYTSRDPYDAITSTMAMFEVTFEVALGLVVDSLRLWEEGLRPLGVLQILYEQIVNQPEDAIRQIAAMMHVQPSVEVIETIHRSTSMNAMREVSARLGQSSESTVRQGGFVFDKETLLHPRHIRHGGCGYGRQSLTSDQLEQVAGALTGITAVGVSR
jgi:hypothetical protein